MLATLFWYASLASLSACAFLALLALFYKDRAIGTKRRPDLVTLKGGLPLLGNLHQVLGHERQLEMWLDETSKLRPNEALSITVPGIRIIDITRPDWIDWVQRTNFSNYRKGEKFRRNFLELLGDGIFNSDDAQWLVARKTTSKVFTGNSFRGIISNCLDDGIEKLVKIISRHAKDGQAFDLQDLFFRFTLDTFSKMAFGIDVGALSVDSSAPVPFAKAFDAVQIEINKRFNNPFWMIAERWTGTGKMIRDNIKIMDDWAYSIIDERQKEGRGNISSEQKKEALDLLSLYMALRDENGQALNRKGLRDALLNLTFAGRDTTAQALSWQFFWLIENWSFAKEIRAELEGVSVNYDNHKAQTRAYAAFNETLRLRPSVPKNGWLALDDDKLPNGGPVIKKGDLVRWGTLQMGYYKHIWGEDAAEWKPSRWIDAAGHVKNEPASKFHAFNSGKRLCLGMSLATYEAVSVTTRLLSEFDFEFEPEWYRTVPKALGTPQYSETLTLPQKYPLMVIARKRKDF